MILTVTNLKGGTSKTTTAAFLAHAIAARSKSVLVIDADPQGSITRWSDMAEWQIPVRGMATARLHDARSGVALEAAGYDAVVIDTPPVDKHAHIAESAIRAATHVLVPVAPTSAEVEMMSTVRALIDDVSHLGRHGAPPSAAVLLTRTVAQAASTDEYRALLSEEGWHVLRTHVPRRERYAQAFGAPIVFGPRDTAYPDALDELVAA